MRLLALAALVFVAGCAHGKTNSREEVREIERDLSNKPSLIRGDRSRTSQGEESGVRRPRGVVLESPVAAKTGAGARWVSTLKKRYSTIKAIPSPLRKISDGRVVSVAQFSETMANKKGGVRVLRSEGRIEVPLFQFTRKLASISKRANELRKKTGSTLWGSPGKGTGGPAAKGRSPFGSAPGAGPTAVERLTAKIAGKQGTVLLQKVLGRRDEGILAKLIMGQLLEEGHAVIQSNGRRYRGKRLYRVRYRRDPPGCYVYSGRRFYTEECEVVFETVELEALSHPCLLR